MKRVLLTGASGFIGRACVAPLLARGYEIHTIARTPANVPGGVIAHRGDLLDRYTMRKIVAEIAPSHLLHAAWDVSHAGYWTSPDNLTWLSASIDLLKAFVAAGGKRAVGVGSCAEYEWEHTPAPGGGTRIAPVTPYGGAKLALCDAFVAAQGMGLDTAWGRVFYPYGPGERSGRLLPSVIAALQEGRSFDCSEGLQVRDFIHVDDVGAAFAQLLDGTVTGAVDIGTGKGVALRDVLGEVIARLGHGELVRFGALPTRQTEPPTLVANPLRLVEEVGFTPSIALTDGICGMIAQAPTARSAQLGGAGEPDLVAEIDAEIARAAPIYHPSEFWVMLQQRNREQVRHDALLRFKRTINNNYFNWLPGDYRDNQMRNLMRFWMEYQSNVPLAAVAGSSTADLWSGVESFGGDNPFANPHYRSFYALFVGLLWHFASCHDPIRLFERIEEPTLGAPLPVYADGKLISQDLANSIHEWSRVRQMVQGLPLPRVPRVMELGAGYGRLAYVFAKAAPCKYVIVDIAPALAVAQWYLTEALPGRTFFKFRHFDSYADIMDEFEAADICFLSANQLELLPDDVIDISVSISSLHEMRRDQIAHFKTLIEAKTRFAVYFKQWNLWKNPVDQIVVRREDFLLGGSWRLVMDSLHAVHDAFCELGFINDNHSGPQGPLQSLRTLLSNDRGVD
ncbi:putative sugar O-methyltransferase [Limobrevibacterium gyesilva]|uniref:Sugar O-methyltransferase n=1 Tax=Limobrevibacterium gyesilva TaxID=2991712 RepID=A0AA41YJV4_9PROT|nr:putative sugar O-methyltransferase [Limobrevibacterium gyesilva]MCW3473925.1 putative sugar O-methyltransferase [Limobrevibacterium gyesilva]